MHHASCIATTKTSDSVICSSFNLTLVTSLTRYSKARELVLYLAHFINETNLRLFEINEAFWYYYSSVAQILSDRSSSCKGGAKIPDLVCLSSITLHSILKCKPPSTVLKIHVSAYCSLDYASLSHNLKPFLPNTA